MKLFARDYRFRRSTRSLLPSNIWDSFLNAVLLIRLCRADGFGRDDFPALKSAARFR